VGFTRELTHFGCGFHPEKDAVVRRKDAFHPEKGAFPYWNLMISKGNPAINKKKQEKNRPTARLPSARSSLRPRFTGLMRWRLRRP